MLVIVPPVIASTELSVTGTPALLTWIDVKAPEELKKAICGVEPCKAIDMGCGEGLYTLYLDSKGFDVRGVDISARAIGYAIQNAEAAGKDVDFCQMNLLDGLGGLEEKFDFEVYPNPVKTIATINSEEITSVEIYDLMGSLILRRNSNKVNMSNLSPGIYFVVGFDKNSYTLYKGKIIKK